MKRIVTPKNQTETSNFLSDISPDQKAWDTHKTANTELAKIIKNTYPEKSAQASFCSNMLWFRWHFEQVSQDSKFKLESTISCHIRVCPICQWRRSLMWRSRFLKAVPQILEERPRDRFLFLTLTVKNCAIEELRSTIQCMNKSWAKMIKKNKFEIVVGWLKTTEVTRGEDGSAHPHFHILLQVPSNFFGCSYIRHEEWRELWKKSAKLDYDPMVNIKTVKGQPDRSVIEVLKYSVKPSDLLAENNWTIQYMSQVQNLRFVASGGSLKNILKHKNDQQELLLDEREPEDIPLSDPVSFGYSIPDKRYRKT